MPVAEIEIINKLGLHARASAKLSQLAAQFPCEIFLSRNGRQINAKSIMGVMMLAAGIGSTVTLETVGEKEEEAIIKQNNIKVITVAEIRKKGVMHAVRQTLLHLSNCDQIYLSFDVDSLDSAISRGTGTPVINGLKEREAEDLVATLMQNHKICCLEITEVNPTLDKENLMAEIAFNILQRSVNQLLMN